MSEIEFLQCSLGNNFSKQITLEKQHPFVLNAPIFKFVDPQSHGLSFDNSHKLFITHVKITW